MKKLFLLAAIAVLSIQTIDAQNRGGQRPGGKGKPGTEKLSPEEQIEKRVERLNKTLNLTDAQKSEIEDILKEDLNAKKEQREAQKEKSKAAREKMQAARKAEAEAVNNKIEKVLNSDQKETYSKMLEKKEERQSLPKGKRAPGMNK